MKSILLGAILVAIGSLIAGRQFDLLQDLDRRPLPLTTTARPIECKR